MSTTDQSSVTAEPWMTMAEACKYAQMHEKTIAALAREGKIRAGRLGREWRFKASLIDEYLLRHEEVAA